jgi:hypothetical protein
MASAGACASAGKKTAENSRKQQVGIRTFCPNDIKAPSFYQDRLGRNIGKALKKSTVLSHSFASVQHADVLGTGASLVFGWIWDIAHPDVERSIREGIGDSAPPDIVVYNAGMVEQTCPPCHAGLAEAKEGAPALAAMVGRLLEGNPGLEFYWRSTTVQRTRACLLFWRDFLTDKQKRPFNLPRQAPDTRWKKENSERRSFCSFPSAEKAFCSDRERWNGATAKLNAQIEAPLCAVPGAPKSNCILCKNDHFTKTASGQT